MEWGWILYRSPLKDQPLIPQIVIFATPLSELSQSLFSRVQDPIQWTDTWRARYGGALHVGKGSDGFCGCGNWEVGWQRCHSEVTLGMAGKNRVGFLQRVRGIGTGESRQKDFWVEWWGRSSRVWRRPKDTGVQREKVEPPLHPVLGHVKPASLACCSPAPPCLQDKGHTPWLNVQYLPWSSPSQPLSLTALDFTAWGLHPGRRIPATPAVPRRLPALSLPSLPLLSRF